MLMIGDGGSIRGGGRRYINCGLFDLIFVKFIVVILTFSNLSNLGQALYVFQMDLSDTLSPWV